MSKRMVAVWQLVLKNVLSRGEWGFVCPAVDDLLWSQSISGEEADLILEAVSRERLRQHKAKWQVLHYGLWGLNSPLRIEWIKAQISKANGD